jgi:hypothetical protein
MSRKSGDLIEGSGDNIGHSSGSEGNQSSPTGISFAIYCLYGRNTRKIEQNEQEIGKSTGLTIKLIDLLQKSKIFCPIHKT